MLPWAHAAFGYLWYSLYVRWRLGRPPIGLAVFALGVGTQFPDLVDKPLTWILPLLPYGRSLGHSIFILSLLVGLLWIVCQHPDQQALVTAFAIGYLSHLIADGIGPAVEGNYLALGYFFWPLTAVPDGESQNFADFFLTIELDLMIFVGFVLSGLALLVWFYDGMPGVKDLFVDPDTKQDIHR